MKRAYIILSSLPLFASCSVWDNMISRDATRPDLPGIPKTISCNPEPTLIFSKSGQLIDTIIPVLHPSCQEEGAVLGATAQRGPGWLGLFGPAAYNGQNSAPEASDEDDNLSIAAAPPIAPADQQQFPVAAPTAAPTATPDQGQADGPSSDVSPSDLPSEDPGTEDNPSDTTNEDTEVEDHGQDPEEDKPEYINDDPEDVQNNPDYVNDDPGYVNDDPEDANDDPEYVNDDPQHVREAPGYVNDDPEFVGSGAQESAQEDD